MPPYARKMPNTFMQGYRMPNVNKVLKLRRFATKLSLKYCKIGSIVQFENGRRNYRVMQQTPAMTGLLSVGTGKTYIVTGAKREARVMTTN